MNVHFNLDLQTLGSSAFQTGTIYRKRTVYKQDKLQFPERIQLIPENQGKTDSRRAEKDLHQSPASDTFPTVGPGFLPGMLPCRRNQRYYEWYKNHRKHGALGRKSPEQYRRENDLISGSYKTEKISDIVSNFNPILSKN